MSSIWRFSAQAEPNYEGSQSSQADFWAETNLKLFKAMIKNYITINIYLHNDYNQF